MQVNPYLFYNGNCEAAFKYYERVLGAEIEMMFGFYLDLLLSGGPWLRDRNLRALIPVRR